MRPIEGPQVPVTPSQGVLRGGRQVPRDLGPAMIAPSQPEALAPERGIVDLPGFNFPPAGTTPVDVIGDANIAPGGTAVLLTITVPATFRFRMAAIGFHTDDPAAVGFLTWAIRLDDASAPSYFGQPAAVGSIQRLTDIVLFAGNGAVVTVVAVIDPTAALTYRYVARARGWFYTEKEGR